MVEIELVNSPQLDVRGIMQARKAGGRAAPFCNRVMQERLPAEFRDRGGKLLGGSRDLEHNSHLFGNLCTVGLQRTHHAVTSIDMEHDLVVVSRHLIIQNPGDSLLNIGTHFCQPGVELPKQEGIAYPTDDDRLVARKFRALQFDRVYLCWVEAAVGHANSDRIYCFVRRLCDVDGARAFREVERVHIFIKAVCSNALRSATQSLTERSDDEVVVPQTNKHDTLSSCNTSHRTTFHHLSGVPGQTCGEAMHDRH